MTLPHGGIIDGWLELAYVTPSLWKELREEVDHCHDRSTIFTFHLCREDDVDNSLLSSLVIQITSSNLNREKCSDDKVVMVHPILCNLLYLANSTELYSSGKNPETHLNIAPLPLVEFQPIISAMAKKYVSTDLPPWKLKPLQVEDLPGGDNCQIHLSIIYAEGYNDNDSPGAKSKFSMDEQCILTFIAGRIIKEGSIIFFHTVPYGYILAKVLKIASPQLNSSSRETKQDLAYRITGSGKYQLFIEPPPSIDVDSLLSPRDGSSDNDDSVPGYEEFRDGIFDLLQIHPSVSSAAISGLLLTGCSGVGKTRLALSVAALFRRQCLPKDNSQETTHQGRTPSSFKVYYLSIQDLIFQSSSNSDLLQSVLCPNLQDCDMWILDDLHLLEMDDSEDAAAPNSNMELLMVRNALIQAIDRFRRTCRIIGITQNEQKLPTELAKIDRLEKSVEMMPPTQPQRTQIWKSLLQRDGNTLPENACLEWAEALTPLTPGCVARDLITAYQNAKDRSLIDRDSNNSLEWKHLLEAVRTLIPSQLAELDVIKPMALDWNRSDKEIHAQAFQNFGGYKQTKKHLYRHVVSPWRRFLCAMDGSVESSVGQTWLQPPPGVLFHGKSGTGKTEAAWCLAASLQLPMIQVRAADVLNKWLGGSESLLRSLFAKARSASPCILFLDEIDSLAGNREEQEEATDYSSRILSTLLNEMDGVSTSMIKSQVLVVACTNRLGSLDTALLRPGRLQEHVFMGLPTTEDLEQMLAMQFHRIPMDSSVVMKNVAANLFEKGATGADVKGLCREVCMKAMRDCSNASDDILVNACHFSSAISDHFKVELDTER
ncbi:ATPase AAA [Nitzschia inconspicua]|uniref:ATPase AAA n=1 Tax=Nitzschia inconspicua TaxID=303405 RepID=A0A9K3LZN8_9STRA|nr:ATPase AAA [Nitzschia inconspicua]